MIKHDLSCPVTIELAAYEDLTRESERLYTVKDYIRNSVEPKAEVIYALLEVDPKCSKTDTK